MPLTWNTTTGNTLVLWLTTSAGATGGGLNTVSDPDNGSYTKTIQEQKWNSSGTGNADFDLFYKGNITGAVTPIITVIETSHSSSVVVIVREYTGLIASPFDVAKSGQNSAGDTSPTSGNTVNTAIPNELIIGGIVFGDSPTLAGDTIGNPPGYSDIENKTSNHGGFLLTLGAADKTVSTIGAQSISSTLVHSASWASGVAAFEFAFTTSTSFSTSSTSSSISTSSTSLSTSSTSSSISTSSTSESTSSSISTSSTSVSSTSASTSSTSVSSTSTSQTFTTSTSSTSGSTSSSTSISTSSTSSSTSLSTSSTSESQSTSISSTSSSISTSSTSESTSISLSTSSTSSSTSSTSESTSSTSTSNTDTTSTSTSSTSESTSSTSSSTSSTSSSISTSTTLPPDPRIMGRIKQIRLRR